jgi:SLT domain-containing protein
VSGSVDDWVKQAIHLLQQNGVPVTDADISNIEAIIQHESSGDPDAVNNWDDNAAAGHPSKGLMQCIDSTFEAYKLPGHDDIFNPVDNIVAGVRYIFARYGGFAGTPGIASMAARPGTRGPRIERGVPWYE